MIIEKTQGELPMSVTDLPLAVLRFQYQMARVPFQVMEEQFVARMNPQAPARLFYERWLGGLDAAAGMVLGDPELEQRGAALAERSDVLGRAAQLDATATRPREQADDELKTKRDRAKQDLNHARGTKQREVTAARNAAEDRKGTAAEAGAKRRAAAKQQADEVAAHRTNAAEAAKREGQAKSRAGEENATKVAESDINDAQATRGDAATQRTQADQVENLADAEKQKQKAVRANSSGSEVGRPGSNLRPAE
jgi:hypothetical protein